MPASILSKKLMQRRIRHYACHVPRKVSELGSGELPQQASPSLLPKLITLSPVRFSGMESSLAASKGRLLPENLKVQVPVSTWAETQTLTSSENHSSFLEVCDVPQRHVPDSRKQVQQPLTNITGPLTVNWAMLKPTLNLNCVSC